MANNVKQAVYPLLITASILGLGVHFLEKIHLRILYNLTLWIIYSCLFYYIVTLLKADAWFRSPVRLINLHIGVFTCIASVILSVYQDKRFRIFIKRLEAIDDTLEELGTPKTYYKLHTWAKRVLIGWLVCCYSGTVNDMIWWQYVMKDWRCMIIPYITNHFYNFNMFVDLLFVTFLWHLHLELCQIARELNAMFGIQMTMEMVAQLIYITRMTTIFFIHLLSENHYMLSLFSWLYLQWISMFLIRLIGLNYICENISAKANEMKKIIHQLTDFLRYADIQDEIHQFILQIMHHPLKFTGLGLFYFGNGFLRNFFTRVSTFVMILVQMSSMLPPYTYENLQQEYSK